MNSGHNSNGFWDIFAIKKYINAKKSVIDTRSCKACFNNS